MPAPRLAIVVTDVDVDRLSAICASNHGLIDMTKLYVRPDGGIVMLTAHEDVETGLESNRRTSGQTTIQRKDQLNDEI